MPKRRRPRAPAEDGPSLQALLATHGAALPADNVMPINIKLTTLADRINNLESVNTFIEGLGPSENPFSPAYATVALASSAINGVLATLQGWQTAIETQFENEQKLAKTTIKTAGLGTAGDGSTYLQYVNISLGDCTVITSPSGKRIMIDCGNSGAQDDIILRPDLKTYFGDTPFEYVRHQINNKRFLNGSKHIDILIYTHPDGDHHNKTKTIMEALRLASVGMVYYGGASSFDVSAFSTTKAYVKARVGQDMDKIRKISLTEDKDDEEKVHRLKDDEDIEAVGGTSGAIGQEFVDQDTDAIVLYYEDDFKLSILAGNAKGAWKNGEFCTKDNKIKGPGEPVNNGTPPNVGSLMVLVETFGQSFLICGDATAITERVAINQFSALLGEVDNLRIAHHGSKTSSSQDFINALGDMYVAVASTAGQLSRSRHRLPRKLILDLFTPLPHVVNPTIAHTIYAWAEDGTADNFYGLTDNLWTTGSNGTMSAKLSPPTPDS